MVAEETGEDLRQRFLLHAGRQRVTWALDAWVAATDFLRPLRLPGRLLALALSFW